MRKKSVFTQGRLLNRVGMCEHREDHFHLRNQSGGGVGPSRAISHQRGRLFTSSIEDDEGVATLLQVSRHTAPHDAETDKTNFHSPLPRSSPSLSISASSDCLR